MISEWLPELRFWLYRKKYFQSLRPSGPVVSIGNLRMGGSGKTPFTDLLLQELAKVKLSQESKSVERPILVVSRNYKAELIGCEEIQLKRNKGAAYYGDEPWLLAQKNPSVRFFVGPNKAESVRQAHSVFEPSLTLVDDGFQHLGLQRDLDIVLLDSSDLRSRIFPWGPLREGLRSLRRAHWIVVNHSTAASTECADEYAGIKKQVAAVTGIQHQFALVQGKLSLDPTKIQEANAFGWAAFAGIARPERFRQALASEFQGAPKEFWIYPNHFSYAEGVPRQILEWMVQNPRSLVFTTEKDAVKLNWNEGLQQRIIAVPWTLEFCEGRELIADLVKLMAWPKV